MERSDEKILSLAATSLLVLSTSHANAGLSVYTNVTQKPVETIRDVDSASEAMNIEKVTYHLLLDIGCTEEEAFMLLFFASVTETGEFLEFVYAVHKFE